MLQVLAKGKGRTIEGVASTSFGKSLAWHWDSGSARALIAKGYWDFVVLQDPGPEFPERHEIDLAGDGDGAPQKGVEPPVIGGEEAMQRAVRHASGSRPA